MKESLTITIFTLMSLSCTGPLGIKNQIKPDTLASTVAPPSSSSGSDTLKVSEWIPCADEYGSCSFSGTHNVSYGPSLSDSRSVIKQFTNGTICSNDIFMDVAPGVVKRCFYQRTATSSPTPAVSSPVITFVSVPTSGSIQTVSQISFSVVSSSTNKQIQCSLDSAAYSNCTSPVAVMSPIGSHVFSVKAIDLTNNLSASTTYSWSVAAASMAITNMNDGTMGMPFVNLSLAPAPAIGKNYFDLIPHQAGIVPIRNSGADTENGEFRVRCGFSHMANNDPIVFPGVAGRSHLHTFFGNTGTNENSTNGSLVTSGNSTCDGGIMNRSGYWIPTIIDTRTGRPIVPTGANMYYKTEDRSHVVAPPKGLRMIAGNHFASARQEPVHFWCANVAGSDQGYIPNCAQGDAVIAVIKFPAYWDGVNLDSSDHKSHMAYAPDATHTIHIPDITYNIRFDVQPGDDLNYWRLSSDMYPSTSKGGFSLHGDWMNGWNNDPVTGINFSEIFTNNCLKPGMNCGNSLTGDGRQFYY